MISQDTQLKLYFKKDKRFQNDEARSLLLYNIGYDKVFSVHLELYDDLGLNNRGDGISAGGGDERDDYMIIDTWGQIDAARVTFESNPKRTGSTYETIIFDENHQSGATVKYYRKNGLDDKVSSMYVVYDILRGR